MCRRALTLHGASAWTLGYGFLFAIAFNWQAFGREWIDPINVVRKCNSVDRIDLLQVFQAIMARQIV